jgi:predicted metal-binding protein
MKVGIVICDRYRSCGAGKCLRAMRERAGAFSRYPADEPLDLVGFSTCAGCPGGNVEYVPEEMVKNGAEAIHLATGLVVGYPPCPYIDDFRAFVERRYHVPVVVGTHPVPEKYCRVHRDLASWPRVSQYADLMADEETRRSYD